MLTQLNGLSWNHIGSDRVGFWSEGIHIIVQTRLFRILLIMLITMKLVDNFPLANFLPFYTTVRLWQLSNLSGNIPVYRDWFIMTLSVGDKTLPMALSNLEDWPSGPELALGFNFFYYICYLFRICVFKGKGKITRRPQVGCKWLFCSWYQLHPPVNQHWWNNYWSDWQSVSCLFLACHFSEKVWNFDFTFWFI